MPTPTFSDAQFSKAESSTVLSDAALVDPANKDLLEMLLMIIACGPGAGLPYAETDAEWGQRITRHATTLGDALFVPRS